MLIDEEFHLYRESIYLVCRFYRPLFRKRKIYSVRVPDYEFHYHAEYDMCTVHSVVYTYNVSSGFGKYNEESA